MEKNLEYFLAKGAKLLRDSNIHYTNLYCFGSHVYGTNDEKSDWDYVAVVEEIPKILMSSDEYLYVDIHFYTIEEFQLNLEEHDLRVLECFFNPDNTKIENHEFVFTLDKNKLRQAISTMMNNSWDKGRKKLILEEDFNLRIALKSLFHSIKTCGYGIQIANQGYISKHDEYNWFLADLWNIASIYTEKDLSSQVKRQMLWREIEQKWKKKLYNDLRTRFKNLCPKESLNTKRHALKQLFKNHKVDINMPLINDIIQELK